ncbi:conserved hypothetical protein [Ricinus communis]|uniref:Uncharacterized protein n=1 Tax=Ricinus communis TaxID=3988 RepID=B9SIP0_RICCO|nr:conserved hypothetical protein [Ricinus communis]
MEDHKRRYLQSFCKRREVGIRELIKCTGKYEARLRESYAETIGLDVEEFAKMMLVDAVFVIQYLIKRYDPELEKKNDRIFEVFKLGKPEQELSMNELVRRFLEEAIRWDYLVEDDSMENGSQEPIRHLVHFLKIGLLPPKSGTNENATTKTKVTDEDQAAAPSISVLNRAGAKFQVSSSKSLLDIEFSEGILKIPKWKINDHTEILFRNIQAFEQCHNADHSLSDYIAIMDFLINLPEDVEILIKNDILKSWLRDNQAVATLVNNLGKQKSYTSRCLLL